MLKDGCLPVGILTRVVAVALLLNYSVYASPQQSGSTPNTDQQSSAPDRSAPPDQIMPPGPNSSSTSPAGSNDQFPDSPGASQSQLGQDTAQSAQQSQQPSQPQPQPQNPSHEPVGTAAAESIPTTGVAASRPAGAALAPAKQRRIRSILIKTGALVGVAVAVGATVALSEGSPSKPPGSH